MRKVIASALRRGKLFFNQFRFHSFIKNSIIWPPYKILVNLLKDPDSIANVQGHKMFLDSMDSLSLSVFGIYEPLETELIKTELKAGDVFLDIGAHIGYYTLIAAEQVGHNGKVIAFEPEPTNFSLLKKNVEMNGYQNVILIQKAVTSRSEKGRLFLSNTNTGNHTLLDYYNDRNSIEIETISLDDYFNDYEGYVDFVKIDVEGAEATVIQGMTALLQKNEKIKIQKIPL